MVTLIKHMPRRGRRDTIHDKILDLNEVNKSLEAMKKPERVKFNHSMSEPRMSNIDPYRSYESANNEYSNREIVEYKIRDFQRPSTALRNNLLKDSSFYNKASCGLPRSKQGQRPSSQMTGDMREQKKVLTEKLRNLQSKLFKGIKRPGSAYNDYHNTSHSQSSSQAHADKHFRYKGKCVSKSRLQQIKLDSMMQILDKRNAILGVGENKHNNKGLVYSGSSKITEEEKNQISDVISQICAGKFVNSFGKSKQEDQEEEKIKYAKLLKQSKQRALVKSREISKKKHKQSQSMDYYSHRKTGSTGMPTSASSYAAL